MWTNRTLQEIVVYIWVYWKVDLIALNFSWRNQNRISRCEIPITKPLSLFWTVKQVVFVLSLIELKLFLPLNVISFAKSFIQSILRFAPSFFITLIAIFIFLELLEPKERIPGKLLLELRLFCRLCMHKLMSGQSLILLIFSLLPPQRFYVHTLFVMYNYCINLIMN